MKEKYTTLAKLLEELEELDNGDGVENLKRQLEVIEDIRHKVDAYKFVLDQLTLQSDYLSAKETEFYGFRSKINKSIANIKERLKQILVDAGTDHIVGNDYVLQTHKSKSFKPIRPEPTSDDLFDFGDFIRSSFAWNIPKIKDAIKLGDEKASSIGEFQENSSVTFKIKRKSDEFK